MNIEELETQLKRMGIPSDEYNLHGKAYDGRMILRKEPLGWVVFFIERGEESDIAWFQSESEACMHFLAIFELGAMSLT